MTSIPDLAPYSYTPQLIAGELAVGWIDSGDDFPTGELPKLLRDLVVDRLTFAAAYLHSGTAALMGLHDCAFCDGPRQALPNHALWGSGEFRVLGADGAVYVAPSLIAHYVEDHSYKPPDVFIEAVLTGDFYEQEGSHRDRAVVDSVEEASDDLKRRAGITEIVHAHVETWNRTISPPLLGLAVGRRWYGPWDGTVDHAIALIEAQSSLGFTPE